MTIRRSIKSRLIPWSLIDNSRTNIGSGPIAQYSEMVLRQSIEHQTIDRRSTTERPLNLPVHYWLLQGHFSWHSQLHWNPTWFLESSGCSTSYNFHSFFKILKFNKILTPFWKAIEWIWMMLFLDRSRISSRCRSQKIASGTDVKLFPERSKYLREVPNECKSSRFNSEMKLSEKKL